MATYQATTAASPPGAEKVDQVRGGTLSSGARSTAQTVSTDRQEITGGDHRITYGSLSYGYELAARPIRPTFGAITGRIIPFGSVGYMNETVRAVEAESGLPIEEARYMTQPTSYGRLGMLDGPQGTMPLPPIENTYFHLVTGRGEDVSLWQSRPVSINPLSMDGPFTIPFEPLEAKGGSSGLSIGGGK